MEERNLDPGHKFTFVQRNSGVVTGVLDVRSFDETEVLLNTSAGKMTIKGDKLHVRQLNLEKGEVELEGRIDNLSYISKNSEKAGRSGIHKLFR